MPEELPVPTNAPPLTVSDKLVWILPNTYGLPSVPTQEGFVDAATSVATIAAGTFDCPPADCVWGCHVRTNSMPRHDVTGYDLDKYTIPVFIMRNEVTDTFIKSAGKISARFSFL